jgi:hypothetical protein
LKKKFILEDQGDVAAYLEIDVTKSICDGIPQFKLSKPHLIQRVISSLGLSDSRLHDTPAEPGLQLSKDSDGLDCIYHWSFCSVIGMLNYLCGTRPDILYSVNQCFCFCKNPQLSHEKVIKRIIRYLKCTPSEGICLCPDSSKVFNVMLMQILPEVGMHQIVKNHLVFIHALAMSLCLQAVLWFGSPSYRQIGTWHDGSRIYSLEPSNAQSYSIARSSG